MIALSNDVMWFIVGGLVDTSYFPSSKLNVSEKFRSWVSGLPSNSDTECNTARDEKGMMPDFC
jgi:hypothetical protein